MNIIDFHAIHRGFMFGIGIFEILLVLIVALIFLGENFPKTILDLARIIRQLKSTLKNAQEKIEQEINEVEQRYPKSLDINPRLNSSSKVRPSDSFNSVQEMFEQYTPDSKNSKNEGDTK